MDRDTEQLKKYVQWALAIAFVALLIALYSISVSGAKAQVIDTALPYSKHIKDGFIEGMFPPTASDGNGIKVFPKGYPSDYVRFVWNNLVWSNDAGVQQGNIISSIQSNPVQVSGDSVFYYAYVNNSKLIKATYINSPSQLKYELELKNISAPNNPMWRVKEYLTIDDVPTDAVIELDDGSAWDKTNQKQSNFFKIKFIDGQKLIIPQNYVFDRQNPSNKVYGYYIMSKAGGKLRGSMISPPYNQWSSMAEPVFDPPVSGGAVGYYNATVTNMNNGSWINFSAPVNATNISYLISGDNWDYQNRSSRIKFTLPNGNRPTVYNTTVSNNNGNNNLTHVFGNGSFNINFTDMIFAQNGLRLKHFINNVTNKTYINVTGNGSIYLYFGNQTESYYNDGFNSGVCLFCDDFNDGNYTDKWVNLSGVTYIETNGVLNQTNDVSPGYGVAGLRTINSFQNNGNMYASFKVNSTKTDSLNTHIAVFIKSTTPVYEVTTNSYGGNINTASAGRDVRVLYPTGYSYWTATHPANIWYRFEIWYKGTSGYKWKVIREDTNTVYWTGSSATNVTNTNNTLFAWLQGDAITDTWDDIIIAPYDGSELTNVSAIEPQGMSVYITEKSNTSSFGSRNIISYFNNFTNPIQNFQCFNNISLNGFNCTVSVLYSGDTYQISETAINGNYTQLINYTPVNSATNITLTLPINDATFTGATYKGALAYVSNLSANITGSGYNTTHLWLILSGIAANFNFSSSVSIMFNNAPTGSINNQSFETGSSMIVTCTANDAESNPLNISMTVNGTLKQSSSCSFDYTGLGVGNYSSQVNITDLNGTIGTPPNPYLNISFWVNVSADVTAPVAPVISNGTVGMTTIVLNSTNNTEIGGWYLWEQKVNTTSNWTYIGNTTINTTTATGLTAGQTYDLRLRVNDSSNNLSPYSNVITIQTLTSDPTDALLLANDVTIINNQNIIIAKQIEQDDTIINAGATGFLGGVLGACLVIGILRRKKYY